jgi:hypothetical protein
MQERLASSWMGLRCLPEPRITLWRRAIALFHEFKSAHWTGPFFKAGYRPPLPSLPTYVVCRPFLDGSGRTCEPDIVSACPRSWSVLELTSDPSTKEADLTRYAKMPSTNLTNYGLVGPSSEPIVFSARYSPVDDGPFPSIILGDSLATRNLELVPDSELHDALQGSENVALTRVPEVPFSFVPESQPAELRVGLVDFVMAAFQPGSSGIRVTDMVEQGLERLSGCVSPTAKERLGRAIESELRSLLAGEWGLQSDLSLKDGVLRAKEGFTRHPKSLDRLQRLLRAWASKTAGPRTTPLDRWDTTST